MEMNKNPLGLASLAAHPVSFLAFMADKSALFKSLAARMVNATGQAAPGLAQQSRKPGIVANQLGGIEAANSTNSR